MAWPRWSNGNAYTDFRQLMAVVKINDTTYESASPAYSPGGFTRAFGGHVYAQAAYVAAQTVKKGFVLHSITGWFTLQGDTTRPFTYRVETIREGGGYCQRQVYVTQDSTKGVCFTCICSFKRPEPDLNRRALKANFREQYAAVLAGKNPDDHPECPGIDSPYWWKVEEERGWIDPFPGLKTRKVDMTRYNEGKEALDRRQLMYYRVIGDMPKVADDANLHAAAHLYASDRNGLFPIANFLDLGDNYSAIASLNHTFIFHEEAAGISTINEETGEPWNFISEEKLDHVGHGRGLAVWRFWREDGLHVASAFQDGMMRFTPEGKGAAAAAFEGMVKDKSEKKSTKSAKQNAPKEEKL
ncbi:acyl-CoA thioesterase II [Verruconis gallopava]|uniref:Acyl-CoA thioesterase II n=1 Tax=Verruconis gallopava TaxID=253628 RepID=A0A0D1YS93_9PEZI|nr:acyl-CoA thioesterase II [Verruconis gallopava]KIW03487.1 acyl-CoA thioesterase II [Verruconis gallopava]